MAEIDLGGHRLRIVRVEQLMRSGPDGPQRLEPGGRAGQLPRLVQQQCGEVQGGEPERPDTSAARRARN